jgi:hypothetical protein
MKHTILFLLALLPATLFAQVEIPNTVEAIKSAKAGDYIVLKDGSHYTVSKSEIEIVNNTFDYGTISDTVAGEPSDKGYIKYVVTPAWTSYVAKDGSSLNFFKTERAFIQYCDEALKNYKAIQYYKQKFPDNFAQMSQDDQAEWLKENQSNYVLTIDKAATVFRASVRIIILVDNDTAAVYHEAEIKLYMTGKDFFWGDTDLAVIAGQEGNTTQQKSVLDDINTDTE